MNKRNMVLSIMLGSVLIAGLFSITYAYFAVNQSNTSSNITVVTGNTTLVLDDVDPITQTDAISPNNTSITRYLTIRNEGSVDGYAKLLFKNLVNTFVLDDLTYTLEEVNSDKTSLSTPNIIVDNEVVPKSAVATNTELADGLLIPSNTSKYYKLNVSYDYKTDTNQDADLNKILTSGFIIEEGSIIIRTTNGIEMKLASSNINNTIQANNSLEKSFTLTNTTNEVQTVDVELTNVANTNENLTASLSKGNTTIVENKSIPIGTNETVVIKKGLEVPANDNSNYTITINNASNTSSNISANINTKEKTISNIYCVDESNNEIDCPTTFTLGDRIAIGRESPQYFRYLRTTNTSQSLNECGTTSSVACNDSVSGLYRFMAEHNLKRTGEPNSSSAIASNALQDLNDESSLNGLYYAENNSNYNTSFVKKYIDNYQNTLNMLIKRPNSISANLMSIAEAISLFDCSIGSGSGGTCYNIPSWASNSNYWLGSPYNTKDAWYINNVYMYTSLVYTYTYYGVRPVIMFDANLI